MRDNRPTPQEILEALYDDGFKDKIFISSVFLTSDNKAVWFYYSKNEDDFDASGDGMLVGETYDELEAVEEATAKGLASLIIQRYRQSKSKRNKVETI
jgi:hypothetical protein